MHQSQHGHNGIDTTESNPGEVCLAMGQIHRAALWVLGQCGQRCKFIVYCSERVHKLGCYSRSDKKQHLKIHYNLKCLNHTMGKVLLLVLHHEVE